jgi:predicted N-acyltransferase
VLARVDAVARELAAACGAKVICCKEFAVPEMPALRPLAELGYVETASLPSCHLPLPWPSWQGYQDAMRAGYRRQLRATLRMRSEHGIEIRLLTDWGAEIDRVFPLYEQVIDRAEYRLERLNRPFFERLAANLPESAALLVESGAGALLAAAILVRGPHQTTFLIAGIDYTCALRSVAYMNLVAAVIEQSIQWGAERLELGQTSWHLKMRLGAETTERRLYFRHVSPAWHRMLAVSLPFLFPDRRFPPRHVFRADVSRNSCRDESLILVER